MVDAIGADRYAGWAEAFTGTKLDLRETYAWGWDELHRIEDQMGKVAERILPGASVEAVIEFLETDPARAIEGEDNLRRWLQDLMDLAHGDRIEVSGHSSGRALEVCPCTRDMAGVEYWRASFHARQPWQVEHLNLRRPATVESWLADTATFMLDGLRSGTQDLVSVAEQAQS